MFLGTSLEGKWGLHKAVKNISHSGKHGNVKMKTVHSEIASKHMCLG